MRDEERGQAEAALKAAYLQLHLFPELSIERAERFIKQQQARPEDGGASERHPLLLPARKLFWQALGHTAELDHLQGLPDPLGDLAFAHAPHGKRIADVTGNVQMRKQGVVLKHHADIAPRRIEVGEVRTIDPDAPKVRGLEAGDHLQQRRLA